MLDKTKVLVWQLAEDKTLVVLGSERLHSSDEEEMESFLAVRQQAFIPSLFKKMPNPSK